MNITKINSVFYFKQEKHMVGVANKPHISVFAVVHGTVSYSYNDRQTNIFILVLYLTGIYYKRHDASCLYKCMFDGWACGAPGGKRSTLTL